MVSLTELTGSVIGTALFCQGYCNKEPQTGWLKTTETYHFTVLEAGSLKSRAGKAMLLLAPLGEDLLLPLPASS